MVQAHIEFNVWDYEVESLAINTGVVPLSNYMKMVSNATLNQVERDYRNTLDDFNKYNKELIEVHQRCAHVFSKVGLIAKVHVHAELKASNYHAAYRKICEYFNNLATSDTDQFERIAKSIRIEPGQDFQAHWINLQLAIKNWAMVIGMEIEDREEEPVVPIGPVVDPLLNQNLNIPEAIANAGDSSDGELKTAGYRILIHETTRIHVLIKSLSVSGRFTECVNDFYKLLKPSRSLKALIAIINLKEDSIPGQTALRNEITNLNKLNKDESSNNKKALVNETSQSTKTQGLYPIGSCQYHPNSNTHNTAMCSKGKLQQTDSRNHSSNESNKRVYDRPFEERHCTYCQEWNPMRKVQYSHITKNCTYKAPPGAVPISAAIVAAESQNAPPAQSKRQRYRENKKEKAAMIAAAPTLDQNTDPEYAKYLAYLAVRDKMVPNPNYKKKVISMNLLSINELKPNIDYSNAILDSGSTDNVVPLTNVNNKNNMIKYKSNLKIGDDTILPIVGKESFGALKSVLICKGLVYPLLSVKYLTEILNCLVFYTDNRAYIMNKNNPNRIVASATISQHDSLYHIDDMSRFMCLENFPENNETTSLVAQAEPPFYSTKEVKAGSAKNFVKNSRQHLNLLQWVHVRLGHPSQAALKKMILNESVLGLGVLWKDVKDMELGLCNACMKSKMHAFPTPKSISRNKYEVFEYITCDYCPMKPDSRRGYKGIYIYGDRQSERIFGYLVKSKTEWLNTLKLLINNYGPKMNKNSHKMNIFMTDFASEVHEHEFSAFLEEQGVKLYNSAPYLHHQNLIERYIQTLKNMLRAAMSYNNVPPSYWCFAFMYTIDTYNMLLKSNETQTRLEVFSGVKTDVSKAVPFYATGWAQISPDERLAKSTTSRSWNVRMLGYAEPYEEENYSNTRVYVKNSYLVQDLNNNERELIRHDVVFRIIPTT
jgi:hypothetical protein